MRASIVLGLGPGEPDLAAVAGRVEQADGGVDGGAPLVVGLVGPEGPQQVGPGFDVGPLEAPDPAPLGVGQVPLLGDVDDDECPLLEGQPDMEADERLERFPAGEGRRRCRGWPQSLAQPVEEGDEDGVLVLEMPVDGRPRHPGGGGDVVDTRAVEPVLLEEGRGRGEDQFPPLTPGASSLPW